MKPDGKKLILIFSLIILSLVIGFFVINYYSDPGSIPVQNNGEPIPKTSRTIHANISGFFSDTIIKTELSRNHFSEGDGSSFIPYEVARMHAEVQLARTMYTSSVGLAATNFTDVSLFPEPIIVFNNDGTTPEYYKFYAGVRGYKNILLTIPASKHMGFQGLPPALGSSDDRSIQMMFDKAQEYYDKNLNGSEIILVRLTASACWGEIVQLDVIQDHSTNTSTVYLDYGTLRDQISCHRVENASVQAIPDRITEWETGDSYYRSVHNSARFMGINLSEPCSWDKRDRMKWILESIQSPLISPR